MAEEKYTIFQRLQKVLSNGSTQKNFMSNNYNIVSPNNSDVIATASSKAEYDKKGFTSKTTSLIRKTMD